MQAHKLFLLAVLLLMAGLSGCSESEDGSSGSGGTGSSTSTSSSGGTGSSSSSSSGGTSSSSSSSTSSSGGTSSSSSSSGGSGGANPDPSGFPSVGVPDQNSLSLSVTEYNPRGRNFDGTEVIVTARLADQLNNNATIPDGTPVYFATEGGSIEPVCTTSGGSCSVTWTSQNPRPFAVEFGQAPPPTITDPLGSGEQVVEFSSGRATVLAWTLGSESFIDNNSNGLFDSGDVQVIDNPEAFLDKNENGTREVDEEFVDYPLTQIGFSGTYDGADGLYSGPDCAYPSLCDADETVFIFGNFELAMTSDRACIEDVGPLVDPGGGQPLYYPSTTHGATTLTTNSSFTFHFLIHDCYGNSPMAGTKIAFSVTTGNIVGPASFTVTNQSVDMGTTGTGGPRQRYPENSLVYAVTIEGSPDNTDAKPGRLEVNVTPPTGIAKFASVTLTDPPN